MYNKALAFTIKAHRGQFRAGTGAPFIVHPLRVSMRMDTEYQSVLALLHDVVEDTQYTLSDIDKHFGGRIAKDIEALTHVQGVSYDEYIQQVIAAGIDVIKVKIADIMDNLSDIPSENMILKGTRALQLLTMELRDIQQYDV